MAEDTKKDKVKNCVSAAIREQDKSKPLDQRIAVAMKKCGVSIPKKKKS